ncbi:glycoside hydrolase family 3 C-terminal domain-containing protein [Evansella cellulosilytica]|uniref:Glycoside hydrolase family 3 domain protein n=1 Tax=Evansella cellulosilytica (strain ATCC 21833 / DSM 2522 / FERM P-1141 / JCM 9156 / N-4) TaxID=649639 RepID=E6TZC5_EVAC2|nr:glycoside hydrolase family 3 C-terminal domain-containing protein [Evansella cellulosilytica]ADU28987.1 glycoside hydrolase family 3 domain protein [Evansella cellulosilytica DSM 2522]
MTRKIQEIIKEMTLEEKAGLCSGLNFWHLKGIERLGIPSVMVTDGPHGLRKQQEGADHLGLYNSVPSTCFPSAVGLASTWDRKLIYDVGVALGEECQAEDVAVLLGPGANIKRSPLCGRNFEYFSEDPYLSTEMAANHIKGVQSQGVGTSLKHFAANNQEHRRMSVDAVIDERTLREIYLASFEGAVKEGQPWTVMCSYNRVNGVYASESERLLTEILRDEWGFEGFVVSDWGAVNERVDALKAGLELEMPSSNGLGDKKIVAAVKDGSLLMETLDQAVERLLTIIFKYVDNKKENASYDKDEHHLLARKVASDGMVLLKNEENVLPLQKDSKIAILGEFVEKPRFQGGGSSHINPTKLENALDEMKMLAENESNISYAKGYTLDSNDTDQSLLDEAIEVAKNADTAVLFVGLPDRFESEGYDREHLRIPDNHRALIEEVSKVQPNVVVVLSNGSPIEMPWLGNVKAVLEGYLGGQATAGAIADLLYGKVSPSGKLAETFPQMLEHNPSHLNFPGEGDKVEYKEGIFVGYRYYDTKKVEPLFPFGFGLSYTQFEYSNIQVSKSNITDEESIDITVTVKNVGSVPGKDVVQLYVRDVKSNVIRPEKELKGFEKVELKPGEEKQVQFSLDKRSFAYYNTEIQDWHVETGDFELLVGKSSKDIVLSETVHVTSTVDLPFKVHRNSTAGDILAHPELAPVFQEYMANVMTEGPFANIKEGDDGYDMFMAMMRYMPIRGMVAFNSEKFSDEMLNELINKLNRAAEDAVKSK